MKRHFYYSHDKKYYKNEKYLIGLLLFSIICLGVIYFAGFKTGNVIAGFEGFNVGDRAEGSVIITIEEGDLIDVNTPIFLAISKRDQVVYSKSLRFEEFLGSSRNKILPVEKDGKRFFEDEGSYRVNLGELIDYEFNETGEYELIFSMPSFDLTEIKSFEVN